MVSRGLKWAEQKLGREERHGATWELGAASFCSLLASSDAAHISGLAKKKDTEPVPSTQNIGQSGLWPLLLKIKPMKEMKANAPGGETTGQVGKAFKCTVFHVGGSIVTFPPSSRRARPSEGRLQIKIRMG